MYAKGYTRLDETAGGLGVRARCFSVWDKRLLYFLRFNYPVVC